MPNLGVQKFISCHISHSTNKVTQQETPAATQEEETPAVPLAETVDEWAEAASASGAGTVMISGPCWGLLLGHFICTMTYVT